MPIAGAWRSLLREPRDNRQDSTSSINQSVAISCLHLGWKGHRKVLSASQKGSRLAILVSLWIANHLDSMHFWEIPHPHELCTSSNHSWSFHTRNANHFMICDFSPLARKWYSMAEHAFTKLLKTRWIACNCSHPTWKRRWWPRMLSQDRTDFMFKEILIAWSYLPLAWTWRSWPREPWHNLMASTSKEDIFLQICPVQWHHLRKQNRVSSGSVDYDLQVDGKACTNNFGQIQWIWSLIVVQWTNRIP